MICNNVGFEGKITWLTDKPDGQAKKLLDTEKLFKYIDKDNLYTDVNVALKETIDWYIQNRHTWTK
jgi:dTDP-D-glucose 4,6-dehydratase